MGFTKYDDIRNIHEHIPGECKLCGTTIRPGETIFVNTEFDFLHKYCSIDCACIDSNANTLNEISKIRKLSPEKREYWMYFKSKPCFCHCKECEQKRSNELMDSANTEINKSKK